MDNVRSIKDLKSQVFTFADLELSPTELESSKPFRKAVVIKDYEIIIPKDEKDILLRDLKSSPFSRLADRLVQFYVEIDPKIDHLAQNYYLNEYLGRNDSRQTNFHLPWLLPVVRDRKRVFKKKIMESPDFTTHIDSLQLGEILRNILNYANVDQSQVLVESLHNYELVEPGNMINHVGNYVVRLTKDYSDGEITENHLQFRGSYRNRKLVKLQERQKTARKEVVVGFERVDQVVGESLQVVGFISLPRNYPHPNLYSDLRPTTDQLPQSNWFRHSDIRVKPDDLEQILREFLPTIGQILDQGQAPRINFTGVTDFKVFIKLFSWYGHQVQSLTPINRKQIAELIQANLELMKDDKVEYQKTDRLEYPQLEQELIGVKGSGILSDQAIGHPAMIDYRTPYDRYPHIFHRYLRIVGRLDNGNIWLTLINPNSTAEDIAQAVKQYKIIVSNREIKRNLESSYANLLLNTLPNMKLYLISDNPLDNILELRQDKRDQIAWYQYFKQAVPDRLEKNYYYHRKLIGCQHEYDRLYQMFEDSTDPYPQGKRYTRMTPHGGIMCGFCGDVLIEDNDLINQGYDVKGQKINTYDNDGLIRETTNIDLFLKKDKSEVVRSGEKLIEQWVDISEKNLKKRQVKVLKYQILKDYEEDIINNRYYPNLQQNPNKNLKLSKTEFGPFLIEKYQIKLSSNRDERERELMFLQNLFAFFYSLESVYQIIIQRQAVFLVNLNHHLAGEDPSYLDSKVLSSFYHHDEIGKILLSYNLKGKNLLLSLAQSRQRQKKGGNQDGFFDLFADKFGKKIGDQKRDLSSHEHQKLLADEYQIYRRRFLYTPGVVGDVFNGTNPLEHEIVRIFSEYLVDRLNQLGVKEWLDQLFSDSWRRWMQTNRQEAKVLEANARITLIPQKGVLSDKTPMVRPLFDRYLAQKHFILDRKLEQVSVDLVNEHISQIKGGPEMVGPDSVMMKKMYILNKLNCEDWTNVQELDLINVEDAVEQLEAIQLYKDQMNKIAERMADGNMELFYWPLTGGYLARDYGYRDYDYFRYIYQPPDLVAEGRRFAEQADDRKIAIKKRFKPEPGQVMRKDEFYPYQSANNPKQSPRLVPRVGKDDLINRNEMAKDLSFLKTRIDSWLNPMGSIRYLDDLMKYDRYVTGTVNGQLNGMRECNRLGMIEPPYPNPQEFKTLYDQSMVDVYSANKMQALNMKEYIISYLRHHVTLMSRIKKREQMIQYGFEKYIHLFEFTEFNAAFVDFNFTTDDELGRVFTNQEIENLVLGNLDDSEKLSILIRDLQTIFLTDLVRHLRAVRNRAGSFVKGRKKQANESELDAGQIFIEFIQLLLEEIDEQDKVNNVDFNHLEINQMFMMKNLWHKMDNAEKKGELEWKILRHKLNIEEYEEIINVAGGDPTDVDPTRAATEEPTKDDWDDGPLDTENDEDDYNDQDFSAL